MYDSPHARQPTARTRQGGSFAAALALATCWRSLGTASAAAVFRSPCYTAGWPMT